MKLQWSDYGIQTFQEASDYIANNFCAAYADAFDADVLATVELLIDNSMLGVEAYPDAGRPDLRKILCHNRNWRAISPRARTVLSRVLLHASAP
jgi:plasmid stabilization system protein ParE